jgi:myo-inositol-1(or 4)-monophosphatase
VNPTLDWLKGAERHIHKLLLELRPQLLEAQGNIEHKLKDDATIVTAMDVMVEERLKRALAEYDPSIPFSGEEGGADFEQKTFWLVDPIDGTEPFARGMPFATNMIALIDNGEPVLGIIHNIALGDYYLAIKGHGATRDGHPIKVSDRPMSRAFIAMGSADSGGLHDKIRVRIAGMQKMVIGYELTQVACGAIEARISWHSKAKPWDYAPGALLVTEAGGRIGNIGSDGYDFRNLDIVASNAVIFDELTRIVEDHAARR